MGLKRKHIAVAVANALAASVLVSGVQAQQRVEKIEVTGTNIKRADAETASPVQVVTRAEIERSGAQSVNDVLQRITGAGWALDDRITNGFAPGGGSLNLRGLGFNSTLVLLNGRRLPTYPFAQQLSSGSQGFNDINSIPLSAVERIEVLKDGASAVYGADAVAGVVNIIMRQDFTGVELGAAAGVSERGDGNSYGANFAAGYGNLSRDRFNVFVSGNISTRDQLFSKDRWFSRTEDLRPRGGADRRSSYGLPGNILEYEPDQSDYTGRINTNVGGTCGPSTQFGGNTLRGGLCRYDRAQLGSLLPESDKSGLFGRLSFAVTPEITAFAEGMFTRNQYRTTGWPAGTTDDVFIGTYYIPAGSPANPFTNDAEVRYRFGDVGNRGDDGKSDTTRGVIGLKGTTAGWDWEAGANYNRIKIDNMAINNALNSRLMCLMNPAAAASYAAGGNPLGLGTLAQIFAANPSYAAYFRNELAKCPAAFAQYGYYNFVNPSANRPGVADYLRHNSLRQGRSTLDGFDLKASREIMQLAGGPLAIAVGGESRREKVSDIPDIQLQTGDTLAISAAQAFGSRRISALYTELNAPITKALEANVAVRYDRYTGNGKFDATSPKVGLRFQPTADLVIRATASNAFRAPSLFETSPAQQTSFYFGLQDPVKCPVFNENNTDCVLDVRTVQSGNPNLKGEKSTALNFGVVWDISRNWNVTVDAWKIDRKDEIGNLGTVQTLVNAFPTDPNIVVRDAAGRIVQVNVVPVQLNKTKTWGIDLETTMRTDLGSAGKLTTKLGLGYIGSYKFTTLGDDGVFATQEYNGTYNQPEYRGSWDFEWTRGPWEVALGGYAVGQQGGLGRNRKIGAFEIWNLGVTYTGIRNLKVRFGVNNLLDSAPRFNDESSGANAGYNPSWGDVMGRFYSIRLDYKFR